MYDDLEHSADSFDPNAENLNTPLIRRSSAAKKDADLGALRQLANAQARVAISQSSRKTNRDMQIKGVINYLCAFGAGLCGIACLLFVAGFTKVVAVVMTGVVTLIYLKDGRQMFEKADYTGTGDPRDEPEYQEEPFPSERIQSDEFAENDFSDDDDYEVVYEYDESEAEESDPEDRDFF